MPVFSLLTAVVLAASTQTPEQVAEAFWKRQNLTLRPGELAKVITTRGGRPGSMETTINWQGDAWRTHRDRWPDTITRTHWHLSDGELRQLRDALETVDFTRLQALPPKPYPDVAFDGSDTLYVVRQKGGIRWFSTGHRRLEKEPPLFSMLTSLHRSPRTGKS